MRELDDELRHVLRRESPPAGFAERVAQRAAHGRSPRRLTRWLAAAALVAAIAGGLEYRQIVTARAERAAGEAAKAQVIQALRITAGKLQIVRAKVREVGS
jgi:hypothetical protein